MARMGRDRYVRLALAALALLAAIAASETVIPNAVRLRSQAQDTSSLEYLVAKLDWSLPPAVSWSETLFAYPVLILLFALASFLLLFWSVRSFHRYASLQAQVRGFDARTETDRPPSPALTDERVRRDLAAERRQRTEVIEPLLGGLVVSLAVWLLALLIAAKIDPKWSRPFLPPPMLVAQNLQHYGRGFFWAMLRSGWHMSQGIVFGTVGGVLLGVVLSHTEWLRRWTAWHLTVISALPPFLLAELFRQLVRSDFVPILGVQGEVAFKLAVAMATWAVVWPVMTATVQALSTIDAEYRRSIRLLGAETRWETVRFVEFPVIVPPVLANLRIGFVIGLIVLLYGEGYGPPREYPTLGSWFADITNNFKLPTLTALLVFTSFLVLAFEGAVRASAFMYHLRRRPGGLVSSSPAEPRRISSSAAEPRPGVGEERRESLTEFEAARRRDAPRPSWGGLPWTSNDDPCAVRLKAVKKTFNRGESLAFAAPEKEVCIERGSFVSVIGHSGAGKSTLIKLILGFEEPDETPQGTIRIGGMDVVGTSLSTGHQKALARLVSYVTQKPTLLSHITVEDNILFGLRQQWSHLGLRDRVPERRGPAETFSLRYMSWLLGNVDPWSWHWPRTAHHATGALSSPLGLLVRFMGLELKMQTFPSELSGGEAQRLHLLRWIVLGRPILVMDEAFTALDQPLKGMVRDAILRNSHELGVTVLNVSHDRSDVLQVSDRILFIDQHTIVEDAAPNALYYDPKTVDLAIFLGHTNIFIARRDTQEAGVLLIERDEYRRINYLPAARLHSGQPGPVTASPIFVPRSFVNINEISLALPPSNDSDWFQVEDLRFTGTHYEVRLSQPAADSEERFVIESVIQDDELQRLLAKGGESRRVTTRGGYADGRTALHRYARVTIEQAIQLSEAGH